ncbi:MAG: hypothetical protein ACXWCO_03395 [Caldimonas sp.]
MTTIVVAALVGSASASVAADIDVMTQNQYLGADLAPVLVAATADTFDPQAFSAAVVQALIKIAATRPQERVRTLAADIVKRGPDVVAIQEAYRFSCQPYPGFPTLPGKGCDDPGIKGAFSDHLQDTRDGLRGHYVLAGKVTNLNVPALPFAVNGYPALLEVVDRDAIFVRRGLQATAVDFSSVTACRVSDQGCNYRTAPPPLSTPIGTIAIERGFLAVDVTLGHGAFRVFNTHLEQRLLAEDLPQTRLLQVGQAYELLSTALGTWDGVKNVLVLGDINSSPVDTIPVPPYPATLPGTALPSVPPYQVLASAFTDAWTLQHRQDAGFTCCQAEDLTNRQSQLYERIDMILSLTRPSHVTDVKLIGETPGDKTRPAGLGLWPSDHAAVAAQLHFY